MSLKRSVGALGATDLVSKKRCVTKPTKLQKVIWMDKAPSTIWLKLSPLTATADDPSPEDEKPITCILKGFWSQTPVFAGDHVILIANIDASNDCVIVDDNNGFIILFPEIFLTGTTVSQSFYCMRKALIGELMRSDSSHVMLLGTIVHDWFQSCCVAGRDDFFGIIPKISPEEILSNLIHVPSYLLELYGLSLDDGKFNKEALEFLPATNRWVAANKANVIDIEELIWSPTLGLKGRIDLTLKNNQPLEIKTGKPSYSVSHSGQVLMYTMLLSEKNNVDIHDGILYYARDGETKTFQAKHPELRGLIMARNEIAAHSAHPKRNLTSTEPSSIISLARPLISERQCRPCENRLHCVLFHRVEDRCLPAADDALQLPPTHWMFDDLGRSTVAHLLPTHINFFTNLMLKIMRQLDTEIAVRLDKGTNICVPQRALESSMRGLRLNRIEKHPTKSNLLYTFHNGRKGKPPPQTVWLRPGDFVIIREDKPAALVIDYGHLECIEFHSPEELIEPDGGPTTSQLSSVDGSNGGSSPAAAQSDKPISGFTVTVFVDRTLPNMRVWKKVCRIEKYDFGGPPKSLYENTFAMFADNPHAARLRRVLIDGEKPLLRPYVSKELLVQFRHVVKTCTQDVKLAVLKSFMSSYSLVKLDERRDPDVLPVDAQQFMLSPSSTSQQETFSTQQATKLMTRSAFSSILIRSHLASDASVLLVCSTASLLDEILLDILSFTTDNAAAASHQASQSFAGRITRLGQVERIAPALLLSANATSSIAFDIKLRSLRSTEAIDTYAQQLVLVGALAGTKHAVLRRRRFDVCVMPDAERVDLAVAAGSALVYADKFVFIGKTAAAVSSANISNAAGSAAVMGKETDGDGLLRARGVNARKEEALRGSQPSATGEVIANDGRCYLDSDVVGIPARDDEEAAAAALDAQTLFSDSVVEQEKNPCSTAPAEECNTEKPGRSASSTPLLESIFEHMKSSAGSAGVADTVFTYFSSTATAKSNGGGGGRNEA